LVHKLDSQNIYVTKMDSRLSPIAWMRELFSGAEQLTSAKEKIIFVHIYS
jgi:hypothetical protein